MTRMLSHARRLLAALALLFAAGSSGADAPVIAAASDLQFALEEVAAAFRAAGGREVKLVFGSSGNFFRQIVQGAPFQMFLSADEQFVLRLAEHGRSEGRGELYAAGRIVLFVPRGSPLGRAELAALAPALEAGTIRRLAIANPEHAPYGRAAEQALRSRGLWEKAAPRLVLGENVSQAAQFAASGSVDAAIFAYSLALSPRVSEAGSFVLIPAEWHRPLRQRMVLLKGAGETARAFYRFMQGERSRAILARYGFTLPAGL